MNTFIPHFGNNKSEYKFGMANTALKTVVQGRLLSVYVYCLQCAQSTRASLAQLEKAYHSFQFKTQIKAFQTCELEEWIKVIAMH